MKETREASTGLGEGLSEIRSQISTAFEASGIAAAYEAIKLAGEAVEQLGERALQIRTSADVLGINTDQYQALGAAAEEAGVPIENLTRVAERLNAMLTEARGGSGAAEEKLFNLGVTLDQIHDPAFTIAELLEVLHDRLTNSATATDAMNELVHELGARAGLSAEAIKKLDLSAEGVAATMKLLHGQTTEEINQLAESKAAYDRLFTSIKNVSGSYLSMMEASRSGGGTDAASRLEALTGRETPKLPQADSGDSASQAEDARVAARLQGANAEIAAIQLVTKADLEADRDAIASAKQGSVERLAAVQQYALQAAAFYGQNVDKVRAADREVITEARASNDELIREANKAAAEQTRVNRELDMAILHDTESLTQQLSQEFKKETTEFNAQIKEQERAHDAYMKKVQADQNEMNRELVQALNQATQDQLKKWQSLATGIESGFAGAFRGIIAGTESFGQAARNVFTSVGDAAASQAAKNITSMLEQAAVGNSLRAKEIQKDAGAAAAGAYKAIVGIPYVGPFLAPAAAAVAYAGVLAFDSAEGGWDVPPGLNPVTQLHSREMVLPRQQADVIRGLADQGGGGQAGAQGARNHKLNISYTPVGNGGMLMTRDSLTAMLKDLHYSFGTS